jgi:hypothetical protein
MNSKYWKHILHIAISFGILPSGGIILLRYGVGMPILRHISLEIYGVLIGMYTLAAVLLCVLIHTLRTNQRGSTKADINAIMEAWHVRTIPPLRLVKTQNGKTQEITDGS